MTYYYSVGILICVAVSLAVSLNIASGYSRHLSLAHAAFWGLGAYGFALATAHKWNPLLALVVSVLAAALGGLVAAAPTLRVRGDYFLVVTLGMGEALNNVLVNLRSLTGGSNGLSNIVLLPGVKPGPNIDYYYLQVFLAAAVVMVVLGVLIQRSAFGQALRATAEDEEATAALGRNPTWLKVRALTLGAACAGLTGGLYASWTSFISPGIFTSSASVLILATVLLGGIGNIWGAVFGAIVLTALPEGLRFAHVPGANAQLWQQMIYGLLLILLMAVRPGGLLPARSGR